MGKAGCQLVYKCPTWSWEAGDKKKKRAFLPDNQQYLISRNLPCLRRVKSLINSTAKNEEIADIDLDDIDNKTKEKKTNDDDDVINKDNQPLIQIQDDYEPKNVNQEEVEDEDDEEFVIPDMEDYDDADNVVSNTQNIDNEQQQNEEEQKDNDSMFKVKEKADSKILKTRTYYVSITYDKYYRVPRFWLRGYDENGNPLSSTQIFEDISADHAHKTVTVEPHIHTGIVSASIHPCRHSEVMKRFMTKFEESGKQITVDGYLFLFLKFMSAVIPTIQYDFTQSVDSK